MGRNTRASLHVPRHNNTEVSSIACRVLARKDLGPLNPIRLPRDFLYCEWVTPCSYQHGTRKHFGSILMEAGGTTLYNPWVAQKCHGKELGYNEPRRATPGIKTAQPLSRGIRAHQEKASSTKTTPLLIFAPISQTTLRTSSAIPAGPLTTTPI